MVQAIARRTAATSTDVQDFHRNFEQRLRAIAKSHDLLVGRNWEGAPIEEVVGSQLVLLGVNDTDRVVIQGTSMMLVPEAVQYLGLAVHELVTNAAKYGALAAPAGKEHVSWQSRQRSNGVQQLVFTWQESGGPAVRPTDRKGFGQVVLEEIVPGMLGGDATLAFEEAGVAWTLEAPRDRIVVEKSGRVMEPKGQRSSLGA